MTPSPPSESNHSLPPISNNNGMTNNEKEDNEDNNDDNNNNNDQTLRQIWFMEPKTANHNKSTLTYAGVEHIANHKYKPGAYTILDDMCNPIWTSLTNRLPLALAPNAVTTLGGLHCLLSYLLLWHHAPSWIEAVPSHAIVLSGWCIIAYYTLDCMDGKQARRTGTSSPLGQLFDHGFDCLCNLSHASIFAAYTRIGASVNIVLVQNGVQFAFFMAQWEEYYTGILPHATSRYFGVTEMNYAMGVMTILNGLFIPPDFYFQTLESLLSPIVSFPSIHNRINSHNPNAASLLESLFELPLNTFLVYAWMVIITTLVTQSALRVIRSPHLQSNHKAIYGGSSTTKKQRRSYHLTLLSAFSKLLTPLLLSILPPILLPHDFFVHHVRSYTLASGLLFCLLTKKIIVLSMARMAYATFQLEVVPFALAMLWILNGGDGADADADAGTGDVGGSTIGNVPVMVLCALWYLLRLMYWVNGAITQICRRLDIYCFTIKHKKKLN